MKKFNRTGRENSPTITPIWDDRYRSTDDSTTTGYTQNYEYDKLGNIQVFQHIGNTNFTRNFNYTAANNQLQSIDIGMTNYAFDYDECGNQISETTSRHFEWDFGNRLRSFYVQTGTSEPTQYGQYLYDAGGTRVKKLVRVAGGTYTSRVYIDDAFEYLTDGTDEQNLLHIMDDQARIALVRLGDDFGDTTPAIKYNLDDYLGNSTVLLETSSANINKEEYYPFGETSFGSYAKKRYKFSGKERDEESGLYYCRFRYHSAWTCRFISVDPLAPKYPHYCSYSYAGNKVITKIEFEGLEEAPLPHESRKIENVSVGEAAIDPIKIVPFEYLVDENTGRCITYHNYYPELVHGTHMKANEYWVFRHEAEILFQERRVQLHNGSEWLEANAISKKDYYEAVGGYVHMPDEIQIYNDVIESIRNGAEIGPYEHSVVENYENGMPVDWEHYSMWFLSYGYSENVALFSIVFGTYSEHGFAGGLKDLSKIMNKLKVGSVKFGNSGSTSQSPIGPFKSMPSEFGPNHPYTQFQVKNTGRFTAANYGSRAAAVRASKYYYQIYKRNNGFTYDQSIINAGL